MTLKTSYNEDLKKMDSIKKKMEKLSSETALAEQRISAFEDLKVDKLNFSFL